MLGRRRAPGLPRPLRKTPRRSPTLKTSPATCLHRPRSAQRCPSSAGPRCFIEASDCPTKPTKPTHAKTPKPQMHIY
eukprot:2014163-Lingulodinium_polyedra.AAC.1